jgi:hypothetical protein
MPLRRGVETSTASRFLVRTPLAGLLDRVAAAARARGGTVNDAFLAALARSLAEMTPRRRGHRRSALAIALVADRRGAEDPEARAFGVQLGQSVVLVEDPDAGAPGDLLARVAASTRGIKATGALAGPQWNFTLLSRLARRFPSWNTRAWYRKVYPLAGGLTNVRWRPEAFGPGGARIGEYFRLPPPGPVLPLVVAPTTFGETLTVAMGYNESSLDEPAAERLLDLFLRNLDALG